MRDWALDEIRDACRASYRQYERELIDHYVAYFAGAVPGVADTGHRYKASSLASALPEGWGHLDQTLPSPHRHARSARSSQMLALGLLGPAAELAPDLRWLTSALDLDPPSAGNPRIGFEYELSRELLSESPRVTALDVLVDDPDRVEDAEAERRRTGFDH